LFFVEAFVSYLLLLQATEAIMKLLKQVMQFNLSQLLELGCTR
jgi:hypothetical protein